MKISKRHLSFLIFLPLVSIFLIGASAFMSRTDLITANTDTFKVTLNKNNAYVNGSYSDNENTITVKSALNNDLTFGYVNGMKPTVANGQGNENTFVQLSKSKGYFYNKSVASTTKITSVKVTFSCAKSPMMYFGDSELPSSNGISLTSGQTYTVSNYSYFNLKAPANALYVDEIVLTYTCQNSFSGDDSSSEDNSSSSSETPSVTKTLESIKIEGTLNKQAYKEGEDIDLNGLSLRGYYSDSTNKVLGSLVSLYEQELIDYELTPSKAEKGMTSFNIYVCYINEEEEAECEATISGITVIANEVPPVSSNEYYLVNNASDLKVGSKVIIASSENGYALSTTQNSNNRGAVSVDIANDAISSPASNVEILTLEAGSENNTFAFNTGEGYLYSASSSKNYLRTQSTIDDNASYTISISNGEATIKSVGSYTRNTIKFNSNNGSPIFSAYSSGQSAVSIYMAGSGSDIDDDNTGDDNTGDEKTYDNYYSPSDYSYSSSMPENYNEYDEKYVFECDFAPSTGNVNVLVVPIAFDGSTADDGESGEQIISDLDTVFNGAESETGWESVSSYFKECSYGKLNLEFTVAPTWYQRKVSIQTMGKDGLSESDTTDDTGNAVLGALDWYKDNYSDSNGREFDSDSNGYVDCVFLVYAEKDYASANNNYKNFWAYTYWMQDSKLKNINNPGANTFIWMSYDFMYGDLGGSDLIDLDAHTFIHEYGHAMGLDDYYDYDENEKPAGGFDMQDYNVGDHNPFSKMSLGWSKPYVVNGDSRITIKASSLYANQSILIPAGGYSSWNKSPFDEYILLEYYTAEGLNYFDSHNQTYYNYPKGTLTGGIRLYHIDARLRKVTGETSSGYFTGTYIDSINIDLGYGTMVAASNSTAEQGSYFADCGNYRLCHLISQSGTDRMKNNQTFNESDLFLANDTFNMSSFSSFFYNRGKMNDNTSLGFSIKIEKITSTEATILITKA